MIGSVNLTFIFCFNSLLLGIGLAMDAFSVSLANGLNEPKMSNRKTVLCAAIFAVFQAIMPLFGWFFVHFFVEKFQAIQRFIPIIALVLLVYIGGKMLLEGIKNKSETQNTVENVGIGLLLVQGVATSIDALSVGFTISEYDVADALKCAAIIAAVTFIICFCGLLIGKRFGTALSGKASVFGGCILIFIGFEIFISSLL